MIERLGWCEGEGDGELWGRLEVGVLAEVGLMGKRKRAPIFDR